MLNIVLGFKTHDVQSPVECLYAGHDGDAAREAVAKVKPDDFARVAQVLSPALITVTIAGPASSGLVRDLANLKTQLPQLEAAVAKFQDNLTALEQKILQGRDQTVIDAAKVLPKNSVEQQARTAAKNVLHEAMRAELGLPGVQNALRIATTARDNAVKRIAEIETALAPAETVPPVPETGTPEPETTGAEGETIPPVAETPAPDSPRPPKKRR